MEVTVEETPGESTENATPVNSSESKQTKEKKNTKKEDRQKKDVEQIIKSINLPTTEEKLNEICKKYLQMIEDNKKLQFYFKQSDRQTGLLMKEKEQLQHEFNKTVLVKSKLENLCRELQKQNKAIKEESLLKIREEEERRKETQAKFQSTLTEISALLQQNTEKNAKLRDDNIGLTEKFKSVVTQYQLREQQLDKMAKQMALESQLADAKMQKASLEHRAEKERMLSEMEQLKVTVAQCRAKIIELQGTETALRGQLGIYTDKYDEFQNALVKSNQVFGGFKEQMEKMSKKIKKLEKESLMWKQRWESTQAALVQVVSERQVTEERAAATAKQLKHMHTLCRTLQGERTALVATLKEHNIERPALPPRVPTPPEPAPPQHTAASDAKVDAMAANCAQLRQSLAHLQSQLNVLTTKKETNKEEPPKPEKTKKPKSKKNKNKDKKNQENDEQKDDDKETVGNEKEESPGANSFEESSANETQEATNKIETIVVNESNANGTHEPINKEVGEIGEEKEVSPISEIKSPLDGPEFNISDETMESLLLALDRADINLSSEVVNVTNIEDDNTLKIESFSIQNSVTENPCIENSNVANSVIEGLNIENSCIENPEKVINTSIEAIKEEVMNKLNIIEKSNDSKIETSSNEEISHINEVKPIAQNEA